MCFLRMLYLSDTGEPSWTTLSTNPLRLVYYQSISLERFFGRNNLNLAADTNSKTLHTMLVAKNLIKTNNIAHVHCMLARF